MRYRLSKAVRAENPDLDTGTRRALAGVEDCADRLLAEIQTHARDLPAPVRDWRFQTFKVDLYWPGLAVEVNGGYANARGGKHGTARDHQKIRELTLAGLTVLVFTSGEVRADPLGCIADIRRGLGLTEKGIV